MSRLMGYGSSLVHNLVEKATASSPYRESSVSGSENELESQPTSPRRPLSAASPKIDGVPELEERDSDELGHGFSSREQAEAASQALAITKRSDERERERLANDEPYDLAADAGHMALIENQEQALAIALGAVDHPTLLPENIASIITTASLAAKVSLRASALVIEALLETAKYSTSTTLNITRKSLISAVGAARALHYSAQGQTWRPDTQKLLTTGNEEQDAFAGILERYSNLGIYLVHHVFTLTELFTMAGFSLTGTAIGMSFAAAEGSVALLDSMFGSNETSRALASFIALVRREVTADDHFPLGKAGRFQIISGITKSLTAWVCLQNTLFYRIQAAHERPDRLKTWVDATVYEQDEDELRRSREAQQDVEEERHQAMPYDRAQIDGRVATPASRRHRASSETSTRSRPLSIRKQHRSDGFLMSELAHDPDNPLTRRMSRGLSLDHDSDSYGMHDQRPSLGARNLSLATLGSFDADPSQPASETTSIAHKGINEEVDDVVENLESLLGPDDDLSDKTEIKSDRISPDVERAIEELARRHRIDHDTSSFRQSVFEILTSTETKTHTIVRTTSTLSSNPTSNGQSMMTSPVLDRRKSLPRERKSFDIVDEEHRSGQRVESHHDLKTLSARSEQNSLIDLPKINCTSRSSRILEHDEWIEFNSMMKRPEYHSSRSEPIEPHHNGLVLDPQTPRSVKYVHDSAQSSPDETLSRGALSRRQSILDPVGSSQRMQIVLNTVTKKVRRNKLIRSIETAPTTPSAIDDGHYTDSRQTDSETHGKSMQTIMSRTGLRRLTKSSVLSSDDDQSTLRANHSPQHSRHSSLEGTSPEKHGGVRGALRKLRSKLDLTGRSKGSGEQPYELSTSPTLSDSGSDSHSPDLQPKSLLHSSKDQAVSGRNGHRSDPMSHPQRPSIAKTDADRIKAEDDLDQSRKKGRPNFLKNTLSRTSMKSLRSTHSSTAAVANATADNYDESGNFPQGPLARSIARYMRWSSASYGQAFMAVMGIGRANYYFPSDTRNHANEHAFAFHVGLHVDDILLSSFADPTPNTTKTKLNPLVHYLGLDHASKAIVLACRGSLGLSDILVDLTCHDELVQIPGGDPSKRYAVHAGMLASARQLCDSHSFIHEKIKDTLLDYPDYGLVLTGHSLGGGVAALLALFWAIPSADFVSRGESHPHIRTPFVTSHESGLPSGRPIHSYVFGPPAIASIDLSRAMKGLVTSVINGYDFIPTLSLGAIRDLKIVASSLWEDGDAAEEIVGRVVGSWQHRRSASKAKSANAQEASKSGSTCSSANAEDKEGTNVLWSFMSALRANIAEVNEPKLYPAGTVLIIESYKIFEPTESATTDGTTASESMTSASSSGDAHRRNGIQRGEKVDSQPARAVRAASTKSTRNFKRANRIFMKECLDLEARFGEIIFRRDMFTNHSPAAMEKITSDLARAVLGSEW